MIFLDEPMRLPVVLLVPATLFMISPVLWSLAFSSMTSHEKSVARA
jgi:hypothetical protein